MPPSKAENALTALRFLGLLIGLQRPSDSEGAPRGPGIVTGLM